MSERTPPKERRLSCALVTGGAGFIGANFVRHLLRTDADVRIVTLDSLTYAGDRRRLPEDGSARHTFVHGDILDGALVGELLQKFQVDAVVHFAAESHVDRSILGPAAFVETNVRGTFSLLEAVRTRRADVRFHHVSTDEVYGSLGPSDPPFSEDLPFLPNSPYSASKAAAEHLVRAYQRTYGLDTTVSRCSNNYGPYQHDEKLIPTVVRSALKGAPIPIYGSGFNVRDWLYVEDHCVAVDRIVRRAASGSVYNVGAGVEIANLDLARMICRLLDELRPAARPYETLIEFVADRPGHDFRYALDSSRVARDFAFRPSGTFEANLRTTVEWYASRL